MGDLANLLERVEKAEERLRSWERQWPTYGKLMQEHVARTEFLLALALAALDQRAVKIAELVGSAVRTERALQSAEAREAFIRRVASTTIPECAAYDADATLTAIIQDARQALGASHG